MNERKGKQQQRRGKPYSTPADKGKQRVNDESKPRKRDTLKSVTKVMSFLGFAGYYRRFIEGFSKLALSLTQLPCKDRAFVWNVQCENSFNELKQRLMTAPILILPKSDEPFVV